jgi:tRNA G18 (ribose-2'-O)-methylase SpoU
MEVLVHAPEDFNNLCVLARTLEVLGVGRCCVFDPHRIVRPSYGKSYTRKLTTVSAGAFFRIEFVPVRDSLEFINDCRQRTIASVPDQSAISLYDFEFGRDDLLVFGSEARGLPAEIAEACDVRLTIPQRGVTQSLNLCVAAGIVMGEWFRQLQPTLPTSSGGNRANS